MIVGVWVIKREGCFTSCMPFEAFLFFYVDRFARFIKVRLCMHVIGCMCCTCDIGLVADPFLFALCAVFVRLSFGMFLVTESRHPFSTALTDFGIYRWDRRSFSCSCSHPRIVSHRIGPVS